MALLYTMSFKKSILSILSEVRKSEARGRQILALAAHTDRDKDDYRNNIGSHHEQLLRAEAEVRDVVVNDHETAEEERAEDAEVGLPDGEDNERDCKPAAVAEAVVRPDAVRVVHDVVETAETRYNAADDCRDIFVSADVDASCVTSCGILADRAQLKSCARVLEEIGGDERDDYRGVSEEAIGEEYISDLSELCGERERCLEAVARCAQRYRGNVAAGYLYQRAAEEVAEADAESCHRKTSDVLVCTQSDGQEAVKQTHERRAQNAREQGNEHCEERVHRLDALLIEERADNAGDAAGIHDAGDTEVQVAALFGYRLSR
mgnify:FL=1